MPGGLRHGPEQIVFELGKGAGQQALLRFLRQRQLLLDLPALLSGLQRLHLFEDVARLLGQLRQDFLVERLERVHGLPAVEVQNPPQVGRIFMDRDSVERQTGNRQETHRHDAFLFGKLLPRFPWN